MSAESGAHGGAGRVLELPLLLRDALGFWELQSYMMVLLP